MATTRARGAPAAGCTRGALAALVAPGPASTAKAPGLPGTSGSGGMCGTPMLAVPDVRVDRVRRSVPRRGALDLIITGTGPEGLIHPDTPRQDAAILGQPL